MPQTTPSRRAFLASAAFAGASLPLAGAVRASASTEDSFQFEVRRSHEEWHELLTPAEFDILRGGGTEEPQSHPLWQETRPGQYFCKGCDLHIYSSNWKTILDVGWAFFAHGEPNAILMGIDYLPQYAETPRHFLTQIEAHCRRCGSHLGHVVYVENRLLHCINGTAMTFEPTEA